MKLQPINAHPANHRAGVRVLRASRRARMPRMPAISVLILTLNEEVNLAGCIESCSWSDDIVVFDSLSKDRTAAIAREQGARFIQRQFDNYAAQRNAGLREVSFKHPWVLMIDADERTPPDLVAEMTAAVAAAGDDVALI